MKIYLLIAICLASFKVFAFDSSYKRQRVYDSSISPFQFVGNLSRTCTATLVGPKHLLTAAHCLYDYQGQKWHKITSFTPAMTYDGHAPYGEIAISRVHLLDRYKQSGITEYDYAIVELSENIGEQIGWPEINSGNPPEEFEAISITGYPGDKEFGTMWTASCPARAEGKIIAYPCETAGGMSGSAIISQDSQQSPVIYGIHTDGGTNNNFGVRITPAVYRDLKNWINREALEDAVTKFYQYCLDGNLDKVKMAIESQQVFINAKFTNVNRTALHGAALNGQVELVSYLLSIPFIQINRPDKQGDTALILAVKANSTESVKLLLGQKGIDINKRGSDGMTAKEVAQKNDFQQILTLF